MIDQGGAACLEPEGTRLPEIEMEIVDEDPPAWLAQAAERALADHEAGRYVVCDPETFDRLLAAAPYLAEAG